MAVVAPQFVDQDPTVIVAEMVLAYEEATGKKLEPSSVERLIFNGLAYRESLIRAAINSTGLQNLVAFSSAPILDYLGDIVGVVRIPSVPAGCTLELGFVGNVSPVVIPEGTRVATTDQKVFFRTIEAITVDALALTATVKALCDTDGVDGNGYPIGDVNVIMDPQPYLVSAANTDVTAGGAAEESDAQLRERIKLAPAGFSNAGSKGAYKYFAMSANASIVDVTVKSLGPGLVNIYPLIDSGEVTPTEILDAVEAICNDDTVRPLTDKVVVTSPERIEYTLDVELILFTTAIQSDVLQKVSERLDAFVLEKRKKLGRDIIRTQLVGAVMQDLQDSIYEVNLPGFADIIINDDQFAFCNDIDLVVTGLNNG